jgi:hypothetical protein
MLEIYMKQRLIILLKRFFLLNNKMTVQGNAADVGDLNKQRIYERQTTYSTLVTFAESL